MHDERRISKLASAQHSLITLDQLRALGRTSDQVERRTRSGQLERVHRRSTEISVQAHRRVRLDAVMVHRSKDLDDHQIVRHRGVPVTNPLRLLVDLGTACPPAVVANAMDDLVARKVITIAGVRQTLDGLGRRGRSGAGILHEVLADRLEDERFGRSRLEALLRKLCQRAGLPPMQSQYPVVVGGQRRRIDFALPQGRIAIEVDGYEFHSR